MNRRDRLRIDERKRESHQKNDRGNSSSNIQPDNYKNVMDSYHQSQQVIQSLAAKLGAVETNIPKTFRIPRKQSQPVENVELPDCSRSKNQPPEQVDNLFPERGSCDSRVSRRGSSNETSRFQLSNRREAEAGTAATRPIYRRRGRRRGARKPRVRDKKRHNKYKPVQTLIFDHAHPDGKISNENVKALIEGLLELVKNTVLSPADEYPKFLGYNCEDGVFLVMCGNYYTSEFLQDNIKGMPSPWPGAKLECVNEPYDECIVSLAIPQPICHLSEFLSLCKKENSSLGIEKWRRIAHEDSSDGIGKLYTLGMDSVSYELIKAENSVIRCGGMDVKVELLRRRMKQKNFIESD